MTTQGIERIPDSLGYLVINEDGAVVSVSEMNEIYCEVDAYSGGTVCYYKRPWVTQSTKQNSSYLT